MMHAAFNTPFNQAVPLVDSPLFLILFASMGLAMSFVGMMRFERTRVRVEGATGSRFIGVALAAATPLFGAFMIAYALYVFVGG